jgi:outer membrane protein assembly factor BamB
MIALVLGTSLVYGDPISLGTDDWGWWRGPSYNGVANPDQTPPLEWDDEKNVLWKSPIPGRGHGSATVVDGKIFLATADEVNQIQSVLCYDAKTGELLWKTDVHQGGFGKPNEQGNPRASKASSTVACDGERLFINFLNSDAVYTTALSLTGEQLWQQKITDYTVHQGYGSSPVVYGPLVIAIADNKGSGAIVGFDRVTGEVVWKMERPALPNYTTPIIMTIGGKDQAVLVGQDKIVSLDPLTGKQNWEMDGATTECVTSTVGDGTYLVTSGGYPENHISVVRSDGSGEVVWRNEMRVYVPSMIIHDGHLYGVSDAGQAFCHAIDNSAPTWEERVRGKFAASLTLVGDLIYATSDKGKTFIYKANPEAFELVAENKVTAIDIQATPTICGSRIYMRVAQKQGDIRQEMLYCIGAE